jgi:hypothetical protein
LRVVTRIEIEPDEEEVLHLLGRGPGTAAGRASTLELVRPAVEEAKGLCRPRGVYRFVDRDTLPRYAMFSSAAKVGLCICTIGAELEERVRGLMQAGDLVRGVVLDAVGSEMAEATARLLDDQMTQQVFGDELRAGGRFSPGYGDWSLGGQELLFHLLDASRIGVSLSPSLMMIPRKSVSFAVNFGPDPVPPRCVTQCDQCDLEDCPYRR